MKRSIECMLAGLTLALPMFACAAENGLPV
jgi:hypothetical protein